MACQKCAKIHNRKYHRESDTFYPWYDGSVQITACDFHTKQITRALDYAQGKNTRISPKVL